MIKDIELFNDLSNSDLIINIDINKLDFNQKMNRENNSNVIVFKNKTKLSEIINNINFDYETIERKLYEIVMMIDPNFEMLYYLMDLCNWKDIYESIGNKFNILINTKLEKELIRQIIYIEKAIICINYNYENSAKKQIEAINK